MYTQCPDCRASFRVTAAVLQQAAGRVRCGGCGYAFNALERLSKAAPGGTDAGSGGNGRPLLLDDFKEGSATGSVRIEDTGVEWQVVEEDEERATAGDHPQETLDLVDERGPAEERYDDNTPLPGALEDGEDSSAPRRRAEDFLEPRSPELDERQVDLALSEPEEWTDLLAEVGDDDAPEAASVVTDAASTGGAGRQADEDTHPDLLTLDADLEPTGEHPALVADEEPVEDAGGELALVDDDEPVEDTGGELALVEDDEPAQVGIGEPRFVLEEGPAEDADESPGGSGDENEAAASPREGGGYYVPPPTEEEITINRLIDQDLLRLSREPRDPAETGARSESAETPPHVETIIMEGAFVRSSLEGDEPADGEDADRGGQKAAEETVDLRDTYVRTRDSARPARHGAGTASYAAWAGVAALALLLGAQVVHAYRETLATYGAFGQALSSLYATAGAPITPEWDVNAWQFGGTRGSTDAADSVLTISSTLANASNGALPHPLLYVALTDRYEEIIASQLMEAGQYLEIRAADGLVAPGATLQASVTIAPLSPQAAGFKLNVCYPLTGEQVRCATGAFQEP